MSKIKNTNLFVLKESILKILKDHGAIMNSKQIGWALNMKGSQYRKKINRAIDVLKKENLIIQPEKYKFQYNVITKLVVGIIDINNAGHGYVECESYKNDIFIDKKNRLNSLNGDTVSVKIIKSKNTALAGRVQDVLKRRNQKFLGVLKKEGPHHFFIPDNNKVGSDFFIPEEKLSQAKNNDRVIVKFLEWPLSAGCPFGSVIRILNKNFNFKTYIDSILTTINIRDSFSKKIDSELNTINSKISPQEFKSRKDFREHITFTIDPKDAKDFDDALSINFLPNKNIEIGIHIADVSHYVKPDSEIDNEAFLRAFSIYFPGKVIPMLPEKLSNLVCSLRPNEDKLSFSVIIEFDSNLSMLDSFWIGKGIINSNKRFTYEEVEVIITKQDGLFSKEIKVLHEISKNFRKERMRKGSINFERTDISFELNQDNEPIKVIEKNPLEAHKLVEEFMLITNKLVANKLTELKASIYRVHDMPNKDLLKEVSNYLKQYGAGKFNFNPKNKDLPNNINSLLQDSNLKINKKIFQNLILRAMAKANYSKKNIGHYGLGFEKYTHFTSPIRRYADLIIHRLLAVSINNAKYSPGDLNKRCIHFSNMEKIYIDVERKANKFIQLKLLENSIGDTFNGFISGIAKWGIYVELEGGCGEGLVSIKELKDDNYYYNDLLKSFIGRKKGKKYQLGQNVLVEIKHINLFKIELDLLFI